GGGGGCALAAVGVVLAIGHYADVTTPALYGRDINLYWDVRYMPDVAAMIARAAPWWLIALVVAALAALVALLYVVSLWAIGCVADAFEDPPARVGLRIFAAAVLVVFGVQLARQTLAESTLLPTPVTATFARQ